MKWALVGTVIFASAVQAQEVNFQTDKAEDALRAASLLEGLGENEDAVPQDYVAAARADYRRLLTALYAQGYYSGTISIRLDGVEASNIDPLAAPSAINRVDIAVEAGPVFRFGQAEIAPLPPEAVLPEEFASGQRARSAQIRSAVTGVISDWRDAGYAKAAVADQSVVARHADRVLDVDVTLAPGPRLRFGDLVVSDGSVVSDARIRQIAGLPTGEVFNPDEIDRAERRLRRTGAFSSVALTEADFAGPADQLQMNAQIADAKPRRFGFGIELASIEGLTLSTFWLHRNFLGGAERFRVDAEAAGISGETGGLDYSLRGSFTRPATFGPDTELYLRGEVSREDEPNFVLDKLSTEVGFTRVLRDDLTASVGLGLLTAREESDLGTRDYTLLTLPLRATLDRRNDAKNATSGYYIDARTTPFVGLVGDVNGARFYGDMRGYLTPGEDSPLTVAGRLQLGSLAGADADQGPADFLFYSGGGGTVRGQPYQSLGIDRPRGGQTVTTGGTGFAGAQLEARFAVRENISLVGFYDVGQVGDTGVPFDGGDWHAGAGLGVRYNTGIGPIRLDLGTPASGDDAGGSLQVYIGIGQAF